MVLDVMIPKDSDRPCAIVELLQREIFEGLIGIKPGQIPKDELSPTERAWLLSVLGGETVHAITEIGWADEAVRWVETTTASKVSSKADVEQFNAGNGFSLLRFHINDGSTCWLKATGAPNTQERAMSVLLSRLCRDYVPEVVAQKPEWNAWLMHSSGQSLSELPREAPEVERMLQIAVESLAVLQIRTVGEELDLLNAGAVDHRTHVLRNDAEALFAYIDEAMGCQTSTKVSPLGPKRLGELKNIFEDACDYLSELDIPDTILQGDLNIDNILFAGTHCVFIDWSEAYVGNPLVTLEHLLLLNQIEDPSQKASYNRHLRNTYLTAMSSICDARVLQDALPFAPLIAAASTILGRKDWLQTRELSDPRRFPLVRAIARHMDRAAQAPSLLRALLV
ncbi:hypothetical protein HDF16_005125 [Granulicella aggregans]|uniref:Aminoglycoside phosphotransferase domain-containing protein n=1 Tax=Granulicella aggregans TaxID=474949 RepID=A0A7W7ZIX5_9BACT|nr:phosphotransferase [Granulicella aggregans]MBB5060389.1 hypothetical protein [Granulicella aggregans]